MKKKSIRILIIILILILVFAGCYLSSLSFV